MDPLVPLAALVLAVAAAPIAAATYDPCASERPLLGAGIVVSHDASPCLAVEHREQGLCHDVAWGVDFGKVVVGGRDTCQTLVKVDADGCREPCA